MSLSAESQGAGGPATAAGKPRRTEAKTAVIADTAGARKAGKRARKAGKTQAQSQLEQERQEKARLQSELEKAQFGQYVQFWFSEKGTPWAHTDCEFFVSPDLKFRGRSSSLSLFSKFMEKEPHHAFTVTVQHLARNNKRCHGLARAATRTDPREWRRLTDFDNDTVSKFHNLLQQPVVKRGYQSVMENAAVTFNDQVFDDAEKAFLKSVYRGFTWNAPDPDEFYGVTISSDMVLVCDSVSPQPEDEILKAQRLVTTFHEFAHYYARHMMGWNWKTPSDPAPPPPPSAAAAHDAGKGVTIKSSEGNGELGRRLEETLFGSSSVRASPRNCHMLLQWTGQHLLKVPSESSGRLTPSGSEQAARAALGCDQVANWQLDMGTPELLPEDSGLEDLKTKVQGTFPQGIKANIDHAQAFWSRLPFFCWLQGF